MATQIMLMSRQHREDMHDRKLTCSLEKSRHLREHAQVNTDSLPGPSEVQLGHLLHAIRRIKQLDVEQLARISGIAADDIHALERGQHGADVATLQSVAAGLGISLEMLFSLWEQELSGTPMNALH